MTQECITIYTTVLYYRVEENDWNENSFHEFS